LKYGIHDDSGHREKIAELLRFHTTAAKDMTSLKDYITRMKEGQDEVFYICGENKKQVEKSPFLEALKKKGLEVLLMTEPIDEYAMQQLKEFQGKKFRNISKEGLKTANTEEEKKQEEELKKANEELCNVVKDILGKDAVEKVETSSRLADSPCCIVTGEHGWTANMERIMKAQALRSNSMGSYMVSKKTLELNPTHPIVAELRNKVAKDKGDKTVKDLVWLLWETALMTSGFSLDDPTSFSTRIHRMIQLGLGLGGGEEVKLDEQMPPLEGTDETPQPDNDMDNVD